MKRDEKISGVLLAFGIAMLITFLIISGCGFRYETIKEEEQRINLKTIEINQQKAEKCQIKCIPFRPWIFQTNGKDCLCIYEEF